MPEKLQGSSTLQALFWGCSVFSMLDEWPANLLKAIFLFNAKRFTCLGLHQGLLLKHSMSGLKLSKVGLCFPHLRHTELDSAGLWSFWVAKCEVALTQVLTCPVFLMSSCRMESLAWPRQPIWKAELSHTSTIPIPILGYKAINRPRLLSIDLCRWSSVTHFNPTGVSNSCACPKSKLLSNKMVRLQMDTKCLDYERVIPDPIR